MSEGVNGLYVAKEEDCQGKTMLLLKVNQNVHCTGLQRNVLLTYFVVLLHVCC